MSPKNKWNLRNSNYFLKRIIYFTEYKIIKLIEQ
jgi:hypothetical protein